MMGFRALKIGALSVFCGVLFLGLVLHVLKVYGIPTFSDGFQTIAQRNPQPLTKTKIAEALKDSVFLHEFPTKAELDLEDGKKTPVKIEYTFDSKLQREMERLMGSYGPEYGALVAMDASTGRVLSMVSYSKNKDIRENLALRATFPSASVFKVVTAAAAIEGHQLSPDTVVPFNGRKHTLYRSQILNPKSSRFTQYMTLREAFAHSVNTVFGRIAAFTVGSEHLRTYANRFGFNRKIEADLPVQEGRAPIPDDAWGLAETGSGFTLQNTMSPLQGALIAAAVANDGVMMEPFVVQSITKEDGTRLYSGTPKISSVTVDPKTALEIRSLMKETVRHGTSRGAFRGFFKKDLSLIDVGGKTGSLTGFDPHGKYDWFVGYADSGFRRIAVAALTIHGKYWRVKSSYLARKAIESYFKTNSIHRDTVANRE